MLKEITKFMVVVAIFLSSADCQSHGTESSFDIVLFEETMSNTRNPSTVASNSQSHGTDYSEESTLSFEETTYDVTQVMATSNTRNPPTTDNNRFNVTLTENILFSWGYSKNATSISIRGRRIDQIHPDTFANFYQLRKLDMGNNLLQKLPYDIFNSLSRLTDLRLDNNHLVILDKRTFNKLHSLTQLRLHSNQIRTMSHIIHPTPYDKLGNLQYLDLSRNKIRFVHAWSFRGLDNLRQLSLQENEISGMDKSAFKQLTHLHTICFKANPITGMDYLDKVICGDKTYCKLLKEKTCCKNNIWNSEECRIPDKN